MFTNYSDDKELKKFELDLLYYASLLKSYGIEDHEVRSLDQTAGEAIINLIKLTILIILTFVIGVFPSILWGPLRIASSLLAERHRRNVLVNSKIKLSGRDVVARLNARRRHEEEIISCRMHLKLALRKLVDKFAKKHPEFPKNDISKCVSEVLCFMDSKKIRKRLESGELFPVEKTKILECREEIL